jgi:hypothetical protein
MVVLEKVSPYFSRWSLGSSLAVLSGLWLLAQLRVTADENIQLTGTQLPRRHALVIFPFSFHEHPCARNTSAKLHRPQRERARSLIARRALVPLTAAAGGRDNGRRLATGNVDLAAPATGQLRLGRIADDYQSSVSLFLASVPLSAHPLAYVW